MCEQEKQTKEQLILAAAVKEFMTKGYDGARTTSIAKAAGVTHAMLHYYFRTKEHLFECIIDKKMEEIVPLMTHLFGNGNLPLVKRIEEAVSVHYDFVVANPDLPRFLINEVLPNKERCEIFRSKINFVLNLIDNLQREVNEAVARGEVEQFDVLLLFQSILSLNIFPSVMVNMIDNLLDGDRQSIKKLLAQRKAENIELIMRRIKAKQ